MGHSSLIGTDEAALEPAGRDTSSLGPGDSSDSGSDMMGIEDSADADPGVPVDVALRDDHPHPLLPSEGVDGSATDAGGTGERRSASGDAGLRDGSDIGVDHVFTPGAEGPDPDFDPDFDPEPDPDPAPGDDTPMPSPDDPALQSRLHEDEDADLGFIDRAQAGDPLEDEDEEARPERA